MLTTGQIILRLILSVIFSSLIYWFRKDKEKFLEMKSYLLSSLAGTSLSLLSLKIFLTYYSKTDLVILPAVLILGVFVISINFIQKGEAKEAISSLFSLLFVSLIGLIIGFGFYPLAIFLTLLLLIIIFLTGLSFNYLLKKIWKKQK
ncbi:MAG: MgtC/SapB family protein [Patescibacteria group bacterium]